MMWGWESVGMWGWLLMAVSMIAFWGLIIWGIVAIFRPGRRSTNRPDPEQLLAERFAAGDIDEEEYRNRLKTLRSAAPSGRLSESQR